MWKLIVGFIVFAAVALFVLKKGAGNIDMGGEQHGVEAAQPVEAAAAASAALAAASEAAAAAASR